MFVPSGIIFCIDFVCLYFFFVTFAWIRKTYTAKKMCPMKMWLCDVKSESHSNHRNHQPSPLSNQHSHQIVELNIFLLFFRLQYRTFSFTFENSIWLRWNAKRHLSFHINKNKKWKKVPFPLPSVTHHRQIFLFCLLIT